MISNTRNHAQREKNSNELQVIRSLIAVLIQKVLEYDQYRRYLYGSLAQPFPPFRASNNLFGPSNSIPYHADYVSPTLGQSRLPDMIEGYVF